jgi:hypothetical protein
LKNNKLPLKLSKQNRKKKDSKSRKRKRKKRPNNLPKKWLQKLLLRKHKRRLKKRD